MYVVALYIIKYMPHYDKKFPSMISVSILKCFAIS